MLIGILEIGYTAATVWLQTRVAAPRDASPVFGSEDG